MSCLMHNLFLVKNCHRFTDCKTKTALFFIPYSIFLIFNFCKNNISEKKDKLLLSSKMKVQNTGY
jgi:hypothetical protein